MNKQKPYYNSEAELVVQVTIPFEVAKFMHEQSIQTGVSIEEQVNRYFLERLAEVNQKFDAEQYIYEKYEQQGGESI